MASASSRSPTRPKPAASSSRVLCFQVNRRGQVLIDRFGRLEIAGFDVAIGQRHLAPMRKGPQQTRHFQCPQGCFLLIPGELEDSYPLPQPAGVGVGVELAPQFDDRRIDLLSVELSNGNLALGGMSDPVTGSSTRLS